MLIIPAWRDKPDLNWGGLCDKLSLTYTNGEVGRSGILALEFNTKWEGMTQLIKIIDMFNGVLFFSYLEGGAFYETNEA